MTVKYQDNWTCAGGTSIILSYLDKIVDLKRYTLTRVKKFYFKSCKLRWINELKM